MLSISLSENSDIITNEKSNGYCFNIPWNIGMEDIDYITALSQIILPIAYQVIALVVVCDLI